MDILQEYEKNQPKAALPRTVQTQEQLLRQRYAPDTGFFIRLVMKLSGGRIQDTRQASIVLLVVAAVVLMISVIIFTSQGGSSSWPPPGEFVYPQGEPRNLPPITSP